MTSLISFRNILFFLLFLSIPLYSSEIIKIGKAQSLSSESKADLENTLITTLEREIKGYEIKRDGTQNTSSNLESSKKDYLYIEFYYNTHSNTLPPDLYLVVYDPKTQSVIDILSERSIDQLPPEILIVESEFQKDEAEMISNLIKKFQISLLLNPSKKILQENILENLKDPALRQSISNFLKDETQASKDDNDPFSYLKEQFDTATRSNQSVEDLPITVQVISKKEIRDYNYRTLVEALAYKPGIMVSEPGNGETGHHFYQRGLLGNSYTKILLNGIPITPSVVFGMPINEMLYLKHAESIEVVYGPASAVYGADAFAGVVNIKTGNKKTNQIRFETTVGEFGYLNTSFFGTNMASLGDDYLVLNAYGLKSNRKDQNIKKGYSGTYSAEQYYQRNGQFGDRTNFFSEIPSSNSSYGVSISFKKFEFYFDQMKRSDHSSLGQQTAFYSYSDSGAVWSDNITRYALKNSFDIGSITVNSNLSYNQFRLDTHSNYNLKFEKTPLFKFKASDDILLEQTAIFKPSRIIELLVGYSYQFSGVFPKTNDLKLPFNPNFYTPFSNKKPPPDPEFGDFGNYPQRFQNIAGFIQSTFQFDKTSFILGMRYDKHSLYGDTLNPRAAMIHKFTNAFSTRISYTEGFRGAPIYLSYNSIATGTRETGINYLFIPNADLKPEKLRAYEFGLRYLFNKNISIENILFHNYVINKFNSLTVKRDEILYPNSTQDTVNTFGNSGKTSLTGFDLILNISEIHRPTRLNIQLMNSIAKGFEFLPPQYDKNTTDLEIFILEKFDPKKDKINNYRNVPRRMTSLRVSMKLFEIWFLALDLVNSEGWYSNSIRSKAQYDTAEYNPKFDPYFPRLRIDGFNKIDLTSHIDVVKYFRIVTKITNLTNEVFSGKGAYDGANNLDIHPQFRRNAYLGFEVNHEW
jgi:outer membrane receptor for ferrienterochelin and colicin